MLALSPDTPDSQLLREFAHTIAQATRTTMFLSKLKFIAAILLSLSVIPAILASAHLLRPQTQTTAQVAPPQSAPALTPPPSIDAEPSPIPDLDPSITPFIPKSSVAIISVDLNTIDMNAITASLELGTFRSPDVTLKRTAELSFAIAARMTNFKQSVADLRSAGAHKLYVFLWQPKVINNVDNLLVVYVIPTENQGHAEHLAKTIFASLPHKVLDKAVIFNPPPVPTNTSAHETNHLPTLAKALSKSTDSPITCASLPCNIMLDAEHSEKDDTNFSFIFLPPPQNVTWFLLSLRMPPAAALTTTSTPSPSPTPLAWTFTYECKTPAAALAFAKTLQDQAVDPATIAPTITGKNMSLNVNMQSIIASASVTTDGTQVTASIPFQQFIDLVVKVAFWQP